ncbi:MAG: hypothetical protein A2W99_16645 [Bacteroidetes bacterium GWF2_33_16]|nr:MAG: hypothetical protein A2X00_14150 [Bacteroidetes bacterium GWE2_32_14]OFY03379.1 MAG: hypothetical protein A2W99_16645 [Bacteroidetes bacterium GWF2_33_16]
MLNYILSILLFTASPTLQNNSFEGSIDLIYISQYDTTYFSYFVKHDNVRVDKFDKNHKHTESILLDLQKDIIYVISPSRKLYTQVIYTPRDNSKDKSFEVLKTDNTRTIIGETCYQWRVKNVERNTEISYWVVKNDFFFFEKLVSLLNLVDKSFDFFEKIDNTQGYFPLLVEERTILRADKSKLIVQKISNRVISQNYFDIPADYEKVNR